MAKVPRRVLNHFRKNDSIMYSLAKEFDLTKTLVQHSIGKYFSHLCREIVGQQLSGKVANVIFARFLTLFPGKRVSPDAILSMRGSRIRNVGMAWSKVNSIKDLARLVKKGELDLKSLKIIPNEEVVEELTKVKGIGPWTAEMFLMFTLGREDVFSFKDLGLRKAISNIYGITEVTEESAMHLIEKWSPYSTYASFILWHSLDNE